MQALSNNWLLVSVMAPALWALVNIIDLFFAEDVYKDEYDGTIISGLFSGIPWLLFPFAKVVFPQFQISILAVASGYLFGMSIFFYFRAIYKTKDMALIQTLWMMSAVLVPILAYLVLGEKLTLTQYAGSTIVFAAAVSLSAEGSTRKDLCKILPSMVGAILLLSISMIGQKVVYTNKSEFFGGFLMFSLGSFSAGFTVLVIRMVLGKTSHLWAMSRKNAGKFLGAESLQLIGVFCSQRAIDISPAVSFVAVIESLLPAFVIFESLVIFVVFKAFSFNREDLAKDIYENQTKGWIVKAVVIAIMALGIYLIKA